MCHLPPGTENRCVPGLGGGGGLQRILQHQPGGGGHQRGQCETLRGVGGGEDGTNTLAASSGGGVRRDKHAGGIPGGEGGANTMAASPRGGGWDKHPGATPLPQPDEECESCRGKGGEG